MPKLTTGELVEVKLPISGGTAKVKKNFTGADIEEITRETEGGAKRTFFAFTIFVKEWDLQADDESILPITEENIARLDIRDLKAIQDIVTDGKDPNSFLGAVGGRASGE